MKYSIHSYSVKLSVGVYMYSRCSALQEGQENKQNFVFYWLVIIVSPGCDIQILGHFIDYTFSCLWVGMPEQLPVNVGYQKHL
jgi:hypothetical protein